MSKIRKQPKRIGKKLRVQSLRNPFVQQNLTCLPAAIASNLKNLQRIVLRHIDEIICQPEDPPQINISWMKQALYQQQLKISGLKCIQSCSKLKKSITQVDIEHIEYSEQRSSIQELQAPVQLDNMDWIIMESQQLDFF